MKRKKPPAPTAPTTILSVTWNQMTMTQRRILEYIRSRERHRSLVSGQYYFKRVALNGE